MSEYLRPITAESDAREIARLAYDAQAGSAADAIYLVEDYGYGTASRIRDRAIAILQRIADDEITAGKCEGCSCVLVSRKILCPCRGCI